VKRILGATAAAFLAAGCIPADGPLMAPGEDCLECHGGGASDGNGGGGDELTTTPASRLDDDGPRWSAAGTVYPSAGSDADAGLEGARVHLTDANGRSITLRTNQAGNFYTAERLRFPLRVAVTAGGVTKPMEDAVEYGGCNHCHTRPPQDDAPGRLSVQ
jgi:hypothetical protein